MDLRAMKSKPRPRPTSDSGNRKTPLSKNAPAATPSARPNAPKSLAEQSHTFTSTIVEINVCDRYGSRN
jgi:hypothetical protein